MAVLERFPDGVIAPPPLLGLTTRSDGGSQYTSDRFVNTLKGKNRPDQNAYIEAFHKSLKEDCIWQHDFQTYQEAGVVISRLSAGSSMITTGTGRIHQSLKYMTPNEFYAMTNGGSN